MAEVGIIGAGSWGTALSLLLYKNGNQVTVWSALENEIQMLKEEREQKDKLPGVKLPEDMIFTTNLEEAIKGKDVLVLAVPSPFTRSTSAKMKPYVRDGQIIVNVAKGIEDHRRRDSTGKCGSAFRTFPCRRGRKRTADNDRGRI